MDRQRIDKWLWHARFVRTRTDAAALVSSGHVRLNGQRCRSPGHGLKIGDVVTVALDRIVRVVEVISFVDRRGGSPEAKTTYTDLSGRPEPAP